jgi:hypothetical protein
MTTIDADPTLKREPATEEQRRAYSAPKVTRLGSIASLTLTGGSKAIHDTPFIITKQSP